MYQVIDDHDEEDLGAPTGLSVLPFLIGGILAALVFFFVWVMSPAPQATPGLAEETPASRAAYLRALSETEPAFRRARLLDYQRVYPDTDRSDAIAGQLDVINAAELSDWGALVQMVYNEKAPREAKRAALEGYESRWNGRLLGGRGEELDELRVIVDETKTVESVPDRTLDPGKSPISEDIPSDILAGAPPRMARTFPIPQPPRPKSPAKVAPKDVIIPPSVRKNKSPKYPRSAQKRNIGAVVVVTMDVDESGRVDSVDVIEIQAERYAKEFSRAARRAAKRTRFNPKTLNGQPVPAVGVQKRYIFTPN